MKIAVIAAIVSFAAVANANDLCEDEKFSTAFDSVLNELNDDAVQCEEESGFIIFPPSTRPNKNTAEAQALCGGNIDSCTKTINL